jgi:hypothetical protein
MVALFFACHYITQILIQFNWYGELLKDMSHENSFHLDDAMKVAERKFSMVTKEEWPSVRTELINVF